MPLADDGLSGYSERKPAVDWPTNGVQKDQVMVGIGVSEAGERNLHPGCCRGASRVPSADAPASFRFHARRLLQDGGRRRGSERIDEVDVVWLGSQERRVGLRREGAASIEVEVDGILGGCG